MSRDAYPPYLCRQVHVMGGVMVELRRLEATIASNAELADRARAKIMLLSGWA